MSDKRSKGNGPPRVRFVSFAQRMALIDINPLHRPDFWGEVSGNSRGDNNESVLNACISGDQIEIINSINQCSQELRQPGEKDEAFLQRRIYEQLKSTYFESALRYWKGRNLSRDFSICSSHLNPYIRSLPQLIHHLSEIIDILMDCISIRNSLAREPAYHLLSILARVRRKHTFS